MEKFAKGEDVTKTSLLYKRTILASIISLISIAVWLPAFGQAKSAANAALLKGPAGADAIKIPFESYKLPNGLTIILSPDKSTPTVAVDIWYHVGSKNEKLGKTGFAHLFEHLMFSGSENFNHTYINAMERIGATNLNGTTNNDRTNYFENVPTSMLDYALFAESDRMGHLLAVLDQKKLDLQRGVVQNEKRQGENQPYGVTEELLTEIHILPGILIRGRSLVP